MNNRFRKICIISGSVLISAALCLCIFNIAESRTAAKRSQSCLSKLKDVIGNTTSATADISTEDDIFAKYEESSPSEMSTVTIDDMHCCGYLSIAELDLELPVINDFSYEALNTAPCRYSGSTDNSDLIIAAHNFSSHFGKLDSLSDGSEILFTDCSGRTFHYSVISIEELHGSAVEEMLSRSDPPWDLTLFTCTLSGKSRITVRAKLTY